MTMLIFRDLWANSKVWLGFLIVVIATSILVFLSLTQSETADSLVLEQATVIRTFTSPILGLTLATSVILLSVVANLVISSQRRDYALWQIIGVQPSQVRLTILSQLLILAIFGIGIGVVVGIPLVDPALSLIVRQSVSLTGVTSNWSLSSILTCCYLVLGTVLLSSAKGLVAVGRIQAIDALANDDRRLKRFSWLRILLALISLAAVLPLSLVLWNTSNSDLGEIFSLNVGLSMLLCIALTMLFAATAPLVFPTLMRLWTSAIPIRFSSSWFLARKSCQYRLTQSGAAITPLMVSFALTAGIYTVFRTSAEAQRLTYPSVTRISGINDGAIVLMLGGPLILCSIGVAVTIFMTSRNREREVSLLIAAGSPPATLVRSAISESAIYVGTATIVAVVSTFILGQITAQSFRSSVAEIFPEYGFMQLICVILGALVLVGISVIAPVLSALRSSITTHLGSQ